MYITDHLKKLTFACLMVWLALLVLPVAAQDSLTIARGTSTNAWIYVEPTEVRVEVLIPYHVLETVVPIETADPVYIEIAEQDVARENIALLFAAGANLKIDGIPVQAHESRVVFFDQLITNITADMPAVRLERERAVVGMIFHYSTKGAYGKVELDWTLWNAVLNNVRCVVYTLTDEQRSTLSPHSTTVTWISRGQEGVPPPEPLPAPGAVAEAEASRITEILLRNIYRAFDHREEEAVFDALAASVDGPLLTKLYLAIRGGLVSDQGSGLNVRIREVNVKESSTQAIKGTTFSSITSWEVRGTIEHWGHIHERINIYNATFDVSASDDQWKITAMTVNQYERKGSLRKRSDRGAAQ